MIFDIDELMNCIVCINMIMVHAIKPIINLLACNFRLLYMLSFIIVLTMYSLSFPGCTSYSFDIHCFIIISLFTHFCYIKMVKHIEMRAKGGCGMDGFYF